MVNPLPIFSAIIAAYSGSVLIGYYVGRTNRRAGLAIATTGVGSGVVLTVNYFVEVPQIIALAIFAALIAAAFYSIIDMARLHQL